MRLLLMYVKILFNIFGICRLCNLLTDLPVGSYMIQYGLFWICSSSGRVDLWICVFSFVQMPIWSILVVCFLSESLLVSSSKSGGVTEYDPDYLYVPYVLLSVLLGRLIILDRPHFSPVILWIYLFDRSMGQGRYYYKPQLGTESSDVDDLDQWYEKNEKEAAIQMQLNCGIKWKKLV